MNFMANAIAQQINRRQQQPQQAKTKKRRSAQQKQQNDEVVLPSDPSHASDDRQQQRTVEAENRQFKFLNFRFRTKYNTKAVGPNQRHAFDSIEDEVEDQLPFVYKLARSWAWDAVTYRCQTHPEEVLLGRDQQTGENILHWCTLGNGPVRVIQAVLVVHHDAVREHNYSTHNLPIHVACSYRSSYEVIQELIDAYPESVGISNRMGSYPIHIVCDYDSSLSVFHAILSNPYAVPTVGMLDRIHNKYPLNLLYTRHKMNSYFELKVRLTDLRKLRHQQIIFRQDNNQHNIATEEEDVKLVKEDLDRRETMLIERIEQWDFWIKLCWLLLVEYHQKPLLLEDSIDATSLRTKSQITIASIMSPICPKPLREMILLMYPEQLVQRIDDEGGDVPLHRIPSSYYYNNETRYGNIMFWILHICPEAASIRNHHGQLPLPCLDDNLKNDDTSPWSHKIGWLIRANPAAIKEIRKSNNTNNIDNHQWDLQIQQYHVLIWCNLLFDHTTEHGDTKDDTKLDHVDHWERKQSTCHVIYQNLIQNPVWFCGK